MADSIMKEDDYLNALKRLYKENFASLIRFARRFLPVEAAKDVVQDVFVEIWERGDMRYDDATVRSYLLMCVRNKCYNILKHEQMKEQTLHNIQLKNRLLELDYYVSIEKQIIDDEQMKHIYRRIDLLPDRCREIFKLAYYEDKKSAEIAQLLHLSTRTVEHQLYLALKILREKLTNK
ncbi:MAG: RNA polymerase sigma-70 factor [Tannerellaceae bacterium]|nr:RNA polymerase sigma-70 factor [Tannerellaceae bacterium]